MSASGDQHDFTSADMSRSKIAARSTGFSASTTGAYPPTQSLQVHVREEVKVEEETDEKGDFPSSSSMLASSSPYSVRFDLAKTAFDEIELGKAARY
ncbi:uncharacterized protein JCM10292_001766 [Rhodotorula paludigena]|uniref:uncharacterized protein n=1 Tax=Rhodotorula paludigena TaxID=86838 RepID=UPI0031784F2C